MKKHAPNDVAEQLVDSSANESLGVKVDKTLIKQFARRIYGTIKEQMITEREKAEELLNAIFGDVRNEVVQKLFEQNK